MHELQFCFDEFLKNLANIENYIESLELQKKVIRELSDIEKYDGSNLAASLQYVEKIKKVIVSPVQYNALIISLYGCYENYIDNIFKKYIEVLGESVSSYHELPEKLREKHIKKLGDYLINPQRYKNYELTPEIAVKNGYEFMNGTEEINLGNLKLILSHGGNLTIDQILELMRDLGIDNVNQKICGNYLFRKFHIERMELGVSIYNRLVANEYKKLFSNLDNLVLERNNVAHGWVENRIQYQEIKSNMIHFLKVFAEVIKEVLIEELLYLFFSQDKMVEWNKAIEVYDHHILCVNNGNNSLAVGDYMIAVSGNNKKCIKVNGLRIGEQQYSFVDAGKHDIGIEFEKRKDKNIKKNYRFYSLKKSALHNIVAGFNVVV